MCTLEPLIEIHGCTVKEVRRDPTKTLSIHKVCKLFNKTDLVSKRLSSGDRTITEFNKVNEVSGGFCWQPKKIGETSCPTTKHATNGCAQDSANYFDIYFYKSLRLHVQRRVKTPLQTDFFIFMEQEKYCIFTTCCIISLFSKNCLLFYNLIVFSSNNTRVLRKSCAKI